MAHHNGMKSALNNSSLTVDLTTTAVFLNERPKTKHNELRMSTALWCMSIAKLMLSEFGYFDLLDRFGLFDPVDVIVSLLAAARPILATFYNAAGAEIMANTLYALIGENDAYLHSMKFDKTYKFNCPGSMKMVSDIITDIKMVSFNTANCNSVVCQFMREFMAVHPELFDLRKGEANPKEDGSLDDPMENPLYFAISQLTSMIGFSDDIATMINKMTMTTWSQLHRDVLMYNYAGTARRLNLSDEKYVVFVNRLITAITRLCDNPSEETLMSIHKEKLLLMEAVVE